MNTRITYLYRDASNWKKYNEVVVSGTFTADQISEIVRCLNDGEYFIPKQVGFPEIRFEKINEDDHCWFELCKNDFEEVETDPTIDMTAGEVIEKFLAARGKWEDSEMFAEGDEKRFKKCPFCGGKAALKSESRFTPTYYDPDGSNAEIEYWIRCTKCEAESRLFKTERGAEEAWNRRA